MKKTFCVLLAFLMLLPFCPVNSAVASLSDASLAFDGGGLVTLGRPVYRFARTGCLLFGQRRRLGHQADRLPLCRRHLAAARGGMGWLRRGGRCLYGGNRHRAGLGGNGAVLLLRGFRRVFDERHLSAE